MNKYQIAAAIVAKQTAYVTFRQANGIMSKEYSFLDAIGCEVGDWVVVHTNQGPSLGQVARTSGYTDWAGHNAKFVFTKLDICSFQQQQEHIVKLYEQIERAKSEKARKEAMAEMEEMFGADFIKNVNQTALAIAGVQQPQATGESK